MENMQITVSAASLYQVGDYLALTVREERWWKRLWHFITFRSQPSQVVQGRIVHIQNNEIEFKPD